MADSRFHIDAAFSKLQLIQKRLLDAAVTQSMTPEIKQDVRNLLQWCKEDIYKIEDRL